MRSGKGPSQVNEQDKTWFLIDAKSIMAGGTTATERELTVWVTGLAQACGWLVHHNPDSRRVQPGIPDLVLLGPMPIGPRESGSPDSLNPPQLLFVELKKLGRGSKLREEQKVWIDGLQRCGQEALVWTPAEIPLIWTRLTGQPFES